MSSGLLWPSGSACLGGELRTTSELNRNLDIALGHTAGLSHDAADRDTGLVLPGGRAMDADPTVLARIGSRRLKGQTIMFPDPSKPKGGIGEILDACDCEFLHEQLFYEAGTGDNTGCGPQNYFRETSTDGFVFEPTQYDDAAMKDTEAVIRAMRDNFHIPYLLIFNKCQNYISQLRLFYPFVVVARPLKRLMR